MTGEEFLQKGRRLLQRQVGVSERIAHAAASEEVSQAALDDLRRQQEDLSTELAELIERYRQGE